MSDDTPITDIVPAETSTFDLARTDGVAALKHAESMIHYMANKCKGPQFISVIQGRKYPKVEWWTTVGAGLGLFPQEESCVKLEREEEICYQATVGVYRGEQRVSRGSAICSSREKTWKSRDEYAIRSMALTRATGKAYRMAFSFLAVMAGLEPTPAEEMGSSEPEQQESERMVGNNGKKAPGPALLSVRKQYGKALREAVQMLNISPAVRKNLCHKARGYDAAGTAEALRLLREHCATREKAILDANTVQGKKPVADTAPLDAALKIFGATLEKRNAPPQGELSLTERGIADHE